MKKSKVSQILFSGLGGHGSVVFSLIAADKQQNWENSLIFYGNEQTRTEYVQTCKQNSINFTSVLKKEGASPGSYVAVYKALKAQRPDTVLLHSPALILVAYWYCLLHRARLIVIEHNPIEIKRKSEWACSVLAMFFADKVVYLSDQYAIEMKRKLKWIYKKKKARIIPNGIDTELYRPGNYNSTYDRITISMVARFSHTKDQATLIEAFASLVETNPNYRLLLAGDGETKEGLEKRVSEKKIGGIEFLGMIDETEILHTLQHTDIYVHSTLAETMSTSIMQALACGLAIIATNVDGVNNLINGENGLLVEEQNSKELAARIKNLAEDKEMRMRLGRQAREFAKEYLSNSRMFASYNEMVKTTD